MARSEHVTIEAAGHEIRLSNPSKLYFPKPGWTKLDVATYYLDRRPRPRSSTCASARR